MENFRKTEGPKQMDRVYTFDKRLFSVKQGGRKSLFFKVKRTTSPGQLKRTGTPDGPTPELV
jgi:hypothetical protein